MPTLKFKDFPNIFKSIRAIKIVRPQVTKAYFAEATIEEVEVESESGAEDNEKYVVESGDTLGGIATKKGTTVAAIIESDPIITTANQNSLSIGQEIILPSTVPAKEKKQKITFKKADTGNLGKEIYVIVETKLLQGKTMAINVRQGKEKGIEEQDENVMLKDDQGNYNTMVKTTIGGMCETEYLNKDDFTDQAIFKISIDTSNDDKKEAWTKALEDATDKKTLLYILADAHTLEGQTELNIQYLGDTEEGEIRGEKITNRWLDTDGQWFELKNENCCTSYITSDQLKEIFTTATDDRVNELRDEFNNAFDKFSINTCLRRAHFFAQIREEVGANISTFSENLNYSVQSLKDTFSYFRNNPEEAELYGRSDEHPADQEAIGNRAYANRLGNGDIASGDGWNYRGKGYIQLTGRTNYEAVNEEIESNYPDSNINIIDNPDDILTARGALLSAMGYWTDNNLNNLADNGSEDSHVNAITAVINLYTESYSQRREHFGTTSETFKITECNN